MNRVWTLLLTVLILLVLSGCGKNSSEQMAVTETMASDVTETMAESEEKTELESILLSQNVEGKVCVGIVPTEVGYWQYVVIEDQEAAVGAFEKAVNAKYSDEWWIKGDRTVGVIVEYNGESWSFVDSGELVNALGRVKAEDAAELYALCAETARKAGWQAGVEPQQITDLVCATLREGETEIILTDPEALDKLEGMLSQGTFALGGFGCPFTALLDMETENGKRLTIALATDGCGSWMSEGDYYDFGSDSQPLYDLFGVTLDYGEIQK